jgi:hypothetical protein
MTPEQTLKCLELEKQIENILGQDSSHLVNFNYTENEAGHLQLNLETINPKYNQMFLFHSVTGVEKQDVLQKMLDYVQHHTSYDDTYTIQWSAQGEHGVRTSYFHARSIEEALDKFRYGRDRNKTTIFLISLNPKA